jgi:hypothetical protein
MPEIGIFGSFEKDQHRHRRLFFLREKHIGQATGT